MDKFPGSLETFTGYIGPISFNGNSHDFALLIVHYLKYCRQFIYLVSTSYLVPRPPDTFPGRTDKYPGPPGLLTRLLVIWANFLYFK